MITITIENATDSIINYYYSKTLTGKKTIHNLKITSLSVSENNDIVTLKITAEKFVDIIRPSKNIY